MVTAGFVAHDFAFWTDITCIGRAGLTASRMAVELGIGVLWG